MDPLNKDIKDGPFLNFATLRCDREQKSHSGADKPSVYCIKVWCVANIEPVVHISLPRYVRINILKCSIDGVIEQFCKDGYKKVDGKKVNEIENDEFMMDADIPDLLVFSPNTDLHQHALYREGKIFLQDKASCLPAFVLDPPPGSFIIDGCAAPGNKSTHLASIIRGEGTIYSFDLDKMRLEIMRSMLEKANTTCVTAKHQDFLKVRHDDKVFSKVEYILLDPSCSGSGIVSRMDRFVDDDEANSEAHKKRLKQLSGFQTAALSHALQFPNVKRIAYSTCSVHKQENEDVIEKACKRFEDQFDLCHVLPTWKSRGHGDWDQAYKCIRAIPETDHTNGFFVAMFERKQNVVMETSDIENATEKSMVTVKEDKQELLENEAVEKCGKKRKAILTGTSNTSAKEISEENFVTPKEKIKKETNIFAKKIPTKKKRRREERVKKPIV